jgi:hypothetical protein
MPHTCGHSALLGITLLHIVSSLPGSAHVGIPDSSISAPQGPLMDWRSNVYSGFGMCCFLIAPRPEMQSVQWLWAWLLSFFLGSACFVYGSFECPRFRTCVHTLCHRAPTYGYIGLHHHVSNVHSSLQIMYIIPTWCLVDFIPT